MILLKKLHSWRFLTILQLHKPPLNPTASTHLISSTLSAQFLSSFWRPFSISAHFLKESTNVESVSKKKAKQPNINGPNMIPPVRSGEGEVYADVTPTSSEKKTKKPLAVFFQETVGLLEKSVSEDETDSESENKELKCKLRNLEEEIRISGEKRRNEKVNRKKETTNDNGVLENEGKNETLHELFKVKNVKSRKLAPLTMDDPTVYKELSDDMVMFVTHLYNEGYFKDSNFLPRKKFDITCFDNSYARDFVKYAAEQFGRDHQEIAKWLSGSDLKKVALFGCPSIGKKTVFSAKRLRTFFRIQEDNVCRKCALKASCKFVNQSVWKGDMNNLHLAVVMRVITLYALESVPPQLVIPDEIKDSVSRLLKDIVRLSKTVC